MITAGKNLGINSEDESGALTLNTSQIYIKDNKLFITFNLRIPVNITIDSIISIFNNKFFDFNVNVLSRLEPLHIDKNDKLVTTLCGVFNNACSTKYEPIAIGGATYARAFDNCVSFGMLFPGDEDMCHKVDEYIEIDKLILSTNIYATAIYKLLE